MADKPASAAAKAPDPISVQNDEVQKAANKREIQEDIERQSQQEEDKAKGIVVSGLVSVSAPKTTAPAVVVLRPTLVSRTGSSMPISRVEEAYNSWALAFRHCPNAKLAMNSPELLWRVSAKIKRFDTILMHDEFFAWEVLVRVMVIDKDIQCVFVDPIGPIYEHETSTRRIDLSKANIVDRGTIGKYSIVMEAETPRSRVIQEGFETEAQAQAWLTKKKAA